MKGIDAAQARRAFLPWLWGAAAVLIAVAAWASPHKDWPQAWQILLLAICAAIAELRPIYYRREGINLVFSTPFVIGAVVLGGPLLGIAVEGLVQVGAGGYSAFKGQKRAWYWTSFNVPTGLASAAVGGLGWVGVSGSLPPLLQTIVPTAVFAALYLTTNVLLVTRISTLVDTRRFFTEIAKGSRGFFIGLVSYVALAAAVAVLARHDAVLAVPIVFVPLHMLKRIVRRHQEIDNTEYETMVALTIMLQRAHPYTHGHLERVGRIAEEVGLRMGLSRRRAQMLKEAAVLHDIGKIAIDEEVLEKPSKLTPEEYEHVKLHAEYGARILQESERFREIAPWIRHHHERLDGTGYPHKLTEIEIPIESRIIAVADSYDAMVGGPSSSEKRSHREPMSEEEALAELHRCSGTQFDPVVVNAFEAVIRGRAS